MKPTPVKAERAWNRADSLDRPVWVRATVAMRVTRIDSVRTINNEDIDNMVRFYPFSYS